MTEITERIYPKPEVQPAVELTPEQQIEINDHNAMIIERTLDMKRYPRFTEHVIQPLAALAMKHMGKLKEGTGHPEAWVLPEDLEKLPAEGAYLASINHSHNDDSPFVKFLMRGRAPMVLGHVGLYENEYLARVYRAMGSLPIVRPQDSGKSTMSESLKIFEENLENGEPGFLFDETTRAGKLQKFNPGSARLAAQHGLDLYPIAMAGTQIKGSPVAYSVGDPIRFLPEYKDMHPNAVRKLMHAQLQEAMEVQFVRAYELLAAKTGQDFDEIFPGFDYELPDGHEWKHYGRDFAEESEQESA